MLDKQAPGIEVRQEILFLQVRTAEPIPCKQYKPLKSGLSPASFTLRLSTPHLIVFQLAVLNKQSHLIRSNPVQFQSTKQLRNVGNEETHPWSGVSSREWTCADGRTGRPPAAAGGAAVRERQALEWWTR